MRFLDSWLHAASAGYRVGVVYPNISGIKSNNDELGAARLYDDCMEIDY
jgi:hypothetical protein